MPSASRFARLDAVRQLAPARGHLQHPQGRARPRACASGWRSTTSAWASRRSTPTWCSCRRCACSTAARRGASSAPGSAGPSRARPTSWRPRATTSAYRTNAITRHGEHGNALLSRWPMGDIGPPRRQRPPLRAARPAARAGALAGPHGACGGGALRPDPRQPRAPGAAPVALHRPSSCRAARRCWWPATSTTGASGSTRRCAAIGLQRAELHGGAARLRPTFPSRVPVFALDRIYTRGLRCTSLEVPRGAAWARMSDHLPLVAELEAD